MHGVRRRRIPFRSCLWIVSGAWVGIAAGMLIVYLTKHLFHGNPQEETVLLIYTVTMCITVLLFTVIGWLFRDKAKAAKNDADMRYASVPKWKCLLKELLTLLLFNGGAAALMWFLLQAEDRAAG